MSSCGMGGFRKSGGSGASSSPWSHQSRTCQGWVLQAQLQRACISPATTLFTGVWGTAERMSFPGIIWPCLYLRGICCSSKRRSHRISSVTGCLISADEVLTSVSWPSLPDGYSEHGLKFLPLDDSCLHSLQQTSIDWAEAIGTDHRGGILQVSLIQ